MVLVVWRFVRPRSSSKFATSGIQKSRYFACSDFEPDAPLETRHQLAFVDVQFVQRMLPAFQIRVLMSLVWAMVECLDRFY